MTNIIIITQDQPPASATGQNVHDKWVVAAGPELGEVGVWELEESEVVNWATGTPPGSQPDPVDTDLLIDPWDHTYDYNDLPTSMPIITSSPSLATHLSLATGFTSATSSYVITPEDAPWADPWGQVAQTISDGSKLMHYAGLAQLGAGVEVGAWQGDPVNENAVVLWRNDGTRNLIFFGYREEFGQVTNKDEYETMQRMTISAALGSPGEAYESIEHNGVLLDPLIFGNFTIDRGANTGYSGILIGAAEGGGGDGLQGKRWDGSAWVNL